MARQFYKEKLENCSFWLDGLLDKYSIPQVVTEQVKTQTMKLRDENTVKAFTDRAFRSMLAIQMKPQLERLRNIYLVGELERKEIVSVFIKNMETLLKQMEEFVWFLQENEEVVSEDLRKLGGYVDLFFGSILDEQ